MKIDNEDQRRAVLLTRKYIKENGLRVSKLDVLNIILFVLENAEVFYLYKPYKEWSNEE